MEEAHLKSILSILQESAKTHQRVLENQTKMLAMMATMLDRLAALEKQIGPPASKQSRPKP